jgi:organic hydroperoxide reductase OsmC/OhrA
MSFHPASVCWHRQPHPTSEGTYRRDHAITFENGLVANNSAAKDFLGNAEALNPETLLVGALASCHMLTFLAVAEKRGFPVERYEDAAVGELGKNAEGRMAITRVTLKPRITFVDGKVPGDDELAKLHERAHANCFIANSVKADVVIA